MEVKAIAKHIRISPRKVRQVINLIKGKKVVEANSILKYTPKKAAYLLSKVLKSAMSNATKKSREIDINNMYIKLCYANGGPAIKRTRARAMGRANRILKRTSHIIMVLGE
ncbi:MAG: 50S ribosomal protein L22 [bacterium]|nr:50S ribosomal protein L22 [bacterium]